MGRAVTELNKTHPSICVTQEDVGAGDPECVKISDPLEAGSGAPDVAEVEFGELPSFEVTHNVVKPRAGSEAPGTGPGPGYGAGPRVRRRGPGYGAGARVRGGGRVPQGSCGERRFCTAPRDLHCYIRWCDGY